MRRQSIFVAATGASVLMIALVSAATAFVVLNHEEKARVVGGLTIDDGSAEDGGGDHDRSLVMRMADALAARLLQGWESTTVRIAGNGGAETGGTVGTGIGTSFSGDVLGELMPQSALSAAQNTGLRLGRMTFGAYGESGPTFTTAMAMPGGPGGGGGSGGGTGGGGAGGGGGEGGGAPVPGPAPVVDEGRLQLPAPPVTPPGPPAVVPVDLPSNAGPGPQPPRGNANPPAPPFSPILPGPGGGQVVEDIVPAQVPEPASLALLGGALSTLALGAAWRRRRRG